MKISCSKCKTRYTLLLDEGGIDKLANSINSIMTCQTCSRVLSIAACPHCRAIYTVTFPSTLQDSYTVECIKCDEEFTIHSSQENTIKKNLILRGPQEPKSIQQPPKEKKSSPSARGTAAYPAPAIAGMILHDFSAREFFKAAAAALTTNKIITAMAGIIIMGVLLLFSSGIEHKILNILPPEVYPYLRSLISLFTVVVIFFIYVMTSSIISRITIEQVYFSGEWNPIRTLRFVSAAAFLLFVGTLAIPAVIKLLFVLFGAVPVVKPGIFIMIFLPIYSVSFVLTMATGAGFWFFPSIISMRMAGAGEQRSGLFAFIWKNNFSLLYTILILSIMTGLIFGAVYILQRGIFTLAASIGKQYMTPDNLSIFSTMSSNFLGLTKLPFSGSDIGAYKSLIQNFIFSGALGANVIGVLTILSSLTLFSIFIAVISSLSTHVYILMESGIDTDNSRKIRFLLRMIFVLAVLFIIRKLITWLY